MKLQVTEEFQLHFEGLKKYYNANPDTDNPIIGHLWWIKPSDTLWLFVTDKEEGYDGSQTQIGIKQDGTLMWGYFSHCSCYGYEDYEGDTKELNDLSFKEYEMQGIEPDCLEVIKLRLQHIIDLGTTVFI